MRSTVVAEVREEESEPLRRGVVARRLDVGGVRACSAGGGVATAVAKFVVSAAPASPTLT
jgi:hypothetical protein